MQLPPEKEKSLSRLKVIEKIKENEKNCLWSEPVEDDPESLELLPDKIDYLNEKLSSRLFSAISNFTAISHFEKLIKKNKIIIKEIVGMDNYYSVKNSGVIITCNHFNAADNYVVFRAIRKDLGKKHLYKVVREGNFTSFPGLYGFFFRHCNTLPLSRNHHTMFKFMKAVSVLLNRGEKILVYPEQAMWWNYRKPRPMQNGAFKLAVNNKVPVLPMFITMKDTDKLDDDGFFIQEYTLHMLPPIYPDESLNLKDRVEDLKNKNYSVWKELYERVYQIPLVYDSED